jgi:beta-galactosidase
MARSGSRTGSKTRNCHVPDALPPRQLQDLLPLEVTQVSSLRPGLAIPVAGERI